MRRVQGLWRKMIEMIESHTQPQLAELLPTTERVTPSETITTVPNTPFSIDSIVDQARGDNQKDNRLVS